MLPSTLCDVSREDAPRSENVSEPVRSEAETRSLARQKKRHALKRKGLVISAIQSLPVGEDRTKRLDDLIRLRDERWEDCALDSDSLRKEGVHLKKEEEQLEALSYDPQGEERTQRLLEFIDANMNALNG